MSWKNIKSPFRRRLVVAFIVFDYLAATSMGFVLGWVAMQAWITKEVIWFLFIPPYINLGLLALKSFRKTDRIVTILLELQEMEEVEAKRKLEMQEAFRQ